jgi:transcriptional regulator with XRE-family HTH domain
LSVSAAVELRVALALRNLSRREVAQRAGVHEGTLSRVLAERQPASPDLIERVRKAIYA